MYPRWMFMAVIILAPFILIYQCSMEPEERKEYMKKIEESKILNKETLEKYLEELMNKHQTNFKGIGQPMRIALTGSKFGPGIYDIILSLEKDEVLKRLSKFN